MLSLSLTPVAGAEDVERENYGYLPYERESYHYSSTESAISLFSVEEELPASYDSRDYGYVSPVKNQGLDGACWTFAATGALESYMLKFYGEKDENGKVINNNEFDFSENHIRYMSSCDFNNPLGYNVGINSGGNTLMSSSYFLNDFGPVDDENDMYYTDDLHHKRDYSATKDIPKSDYKVDSVSFLPQIIPLNDKESSNLSFLENNLELFKSEPEKYSDYLNLYYQLKNKQNLFNNRYSYLDDIKRLVMEYGSVVCGVYYNSAYLTADGHNLYCNKLGNNHQVLIVGWDDSYSKNNFKSVPATDGAFIVKNSWGEDSRDNGYFYLSYSDYNLFFDLMAITSVVDRVDNEIVYSLDPFGMVDAICYDAQYNPVSYGNSFEKKTENEKIAAVGLYAFSGVEYQLYLVNNSPVDSEYEGVYELPNYLNERIKLGDSFCFGDDGYYTIRLEEKIPIISDKFSIIVKADSNSIIYMPVEKNTNFSDGRVFIDKVVSNEKESFLRPSGEYYEDFFYEYNENGNFCIKAITETTDSYSEFELANFTDENGKEKTAFTAGDTVYIVPALNGANLDGKQIICVGYDENKAVKMLQYKNFNSDGQNRFEIENIPEDFYKYTFYMYVWEMGGLKPLGDAVKVGVEK